MRKFISKSFTKKQERPPQSVGAFVDDLVSANSSFSRVEKVELYIRDYSVNMEYLQRNGSWISRLSPSCRVRALIHFQTEARITFDGTQYSSKVNAQDKIGHSSAFVGRPILLGSQLSMSESYDGREIPLCLDIAYDSSVKTPSWRVGLSDETSQEQSMIAEGFEKAEVVVGPFPFSILQAYLLQARFKVYSGSSGNGIYTESDFLLGLMRYLHHMSGIWRNHVQYRDLPYTISMQYTVCILSSERIAISTNADGVSDDAIVLERVY